MRFTVFGCRRRNLAASIQSQTGSGFQVMVACAFVFVSWPIGLQDKFRERGGVSVHRTRDVDCTVLGPISLLVRVSRNSGRNLRWVLRAVRSWRDKLENSMTFCFVLLLARTTVEIAFENS